MLIPNSDNLLATTIGFGEKSCGNRKKDRRLLESRKKRGCSPLMTDDLILINDVLRLRRVRPSDAQSIYKAVRESIPQVSRWMHWCHPDFSLHDSKSWSDSRADAWKKGEAYDFVIEDPQLGAPIGTCGLNQINSVERFANLGYWVRTSRTRQGIATATIPMVARFGFDILNLNRIEIVVAAENAWSQRVAEKVGALREGVLRQRLIVRETIYDAVMFSLVPQDLC